MVLAPVLFLRNKLRPASGRFPVLRNETKVQIARFGLFRYLRLIRVFVSSNGPPTERLW